MLILGIDPHIGIDSAQPIQFSFSKGLTMDQKVYGTEVSEQNIVFVLIAEQHEFDFSQNT